MLSLIPNPRILVNMLELIFIYFVFAFNEGVFPPHLEQTFGINSFQIGLIYGGAGICQAVSQGLTGRLLHKGYKMYKLNLIGSFFLLAGLFMISPNVIIYNSPLLWVTTLGAYLTKKSTFGFD